MPYTGIIMSHARDGQHPPRDLRPRRRRRSRAGSRTNPGGYAEDEEFDAAQFQLGDHRSLDEVIRDVAELGYIPSFCTACYRLGRTGMDFMDLAKPGEIKHHCDPNALSTFLEYLLDYGSPRRARSGETLIDAKVARDGRRAPRAHREDARPGARRRARRVLLRPRPATHRGTDVNDDHIILGIHVSDRLKNAVRRAEGLHRVRLQHQDALGLHDADENVCSPSGVVLIEFVGADERGRRA